MITISISPDKSVAHLDPCKPNGFLHNKLRALGGFFERKSSETITLPLSSENAKSLRAILVELRSEMPGTQFDLTPGSGKTLADFADSTIPIPAFNVFPSTNDAERFIVDAQRIPLQAFSAVSGLLRRKNALREISESVFLVDSEHMQELLATVSFKATPVIAEKFVADEDPFAGITLVSKKAPENNVVVPSNASNGRTMQMVEPSPSPKMEVAQIALPEFEPFSGFDGSLSSLKWVPLEAYEHIRKDSEKTSAANRRISAANKNAKTKKAEKKLKRSLAQKLSSIGMVSAFDILHMFPLRHIDRSQPKLIRQIAEGEDCAVLGTVANINTDYAKRMVRITFEDMVQDQFTVTFFQQVYLGQMYRKGDQVIVSGRLAFFRNMPTLDKAKVDKIGSDRAIPMIPVYPQSGTQEITTWDILAMVKETLGRLGKTPLEEPFDKEIRDLYRIPTRNEAYVEIHLPRSPEHFADANRRLVYEELYRLQVIIQKQRQDIVSSRGLPQNALETPTLDSWHNNLPYALTGAQSRAMSEIKANMTSPNPMYRLIQGDVGSGKSSLATMAVLNTLDNGHQSALLAPTEILAEQLFNGIAKDVDGLISPRSGMPIHAVFLAGKTTAAQARKIRAGLADGTVDIVVGTHAILTPDTKFKDLGTVVIDEQHRFGVEQRSVLRNERADGKTPDMLLMTATPIPRSSAMVLYGDLDLTILDELPPGRTPIETIWKRVDAQQAVNNGQLEPWQDIRNEVRNGHQAYVVASLVEDNEKLAAQSVQDAFDKLSGSIFPEFRVGMVHGKQKRPEREEIMKSFASGEIDILVATTVIEVGVNVPNSTVMVVLDPGRFGISQLHQIRGRVGRSNLPSRCWLVGDTKTSDGEFRLNALVESTDGFYLSEKDLELRGEGTLFSTKQSGQGDLFLAKIHEHMHVLEVAKSDVSKLLERDPMLKSKTGRIFSMEVEDVFGDKEIKS